MTTLKTERLTLRPLAPADAEAYAALRFHPELVKWLPVAQGDSIELVRGTIERFAAGCGNDTMRRGACFWEPG